MLDFKTGDLFADFDELDAVGQGCNTMSLMGAGVAYVFGSKYPDMVEAYKEVCETKESDEILGDFFLWRDDETETLIFNLFTQIVGGADARLDAIAESVDEMMFFLEEEFEDSISEGFPVVVGIPRIGAGIGGLDWEDVQIVLEAVCEDHPNITLRVYTLPGEFGTPPLEAKTEIMKVIHPDVAASPLTMKAVLESMDDHDRKYYEDRDFREMCDRVNQLALALSRIAVETDDKLARLLAQDALGLHPTS